MLLDSCVLFLMAKLMLYVVIMRLRLIEKIYRNPFLLQNNIYGVQ